MTLPLNQGQTAAADAFFAFLFSDEKEFIISGPGGTGKTHLMSVLIDKIMPRYYETCGFMGLEPKYSEVVMTATTNKAAEVLAIATQRPTSTIHSFMNLKPQEDFSTGKVRLTKTRTWKVHENQIIFIDEYSMIDSNLLKAIHEGTLNCKIVYVGDHCQLPPVGEAISPVVNRGIQLYELTEPMRTNVPELQMLNAQFRHTVETGDFYPIEIKPGIIDWLDDDQMQAELAQTFTNVTRSSKIVSYTNGRVNQFNGHIRELRHLPEHYTVGEYLVNNQGIQIGKHMLSAEQEVEIVNLARRTTTITIAENAYLEVVYATLKLSSGGHIEKVPVPVDRDHFNALVKFYQKQKNWPVYFELKNKYPDLRPFDASTVHKSQGSTYDTVFVDLGNISTCHQPNQVSRMLYVALSRAKHRVCLYGTLADKYGGLVF